AYQLIRFGPKDKAIGAADRTWLENFIQSSNFDLEEAQLEETKIRYRKITELVTKALFQKSEPKPKSNLDKVFLHPVFGYLIFVGVLLLIFQSIFSWASYPMDLIDGLFANIS